ncbi:hypothetical protein [Nostoc sp.]|uniref:hypothetical protein n=1 Tax=Nostoc sp. TaxID=1180 RepID=UPI002FF758ED
MANYVLYHPNYTVLIILSKSTQRSTCRNEESLTNRRVSGAMFAALGLGTGDWGLETGDWEKFFTIWWLLITHHQNFSI